MQIFCFGGRLVFGPDVRSLFLTVFLIVTPVIFFCAFVSRMLINEFQHHLGNLIVVVCAIFTVYVSCFSFTDCRLLHFRDLFPPHSGVSRNIFIELKLNCKTKSRKLREPCRIFIQEPNLPRGMLIKVVQIWVKHTMKKT